MKFRAGEIIRSRRPGLKARGQEGAGRTRFATMLPDRLRVQG